MTLIGSGRILQSGVDFSTLSGDATATSGGVVTLADPHAIYTATTSLDASTIVGSTAGTLGHANGVTLVAAAPGKRIFLVECYVVFTFATAAYTGGGTTSLRYLDAAGNAISGAQTAAATFLSVSSRTWAYTPASFNNGGLSGGVGVGVALASGAAFTQPGTAAGTAAIITRYRLVT